MLKYRLAFLSVLLVLSSVLLNAQMKGLSSFDIEDMMKSDAIEQLNSEQISKTTALPFGDVVDADYYFVGPGDILFIQNLSSISQKEMVFISPENTLHIPRIGEVDLNGKTLSETKKLIVEKIKGNLSNSLIYVSLYKPRNVIVEVKGNVDIPGTYTFPASYRISTVIKFANQRKPSTFMPMTQSTALYNKFEKNQYLQMLFTNGELPYISDYSNRNILILQSDGNTKIADIEKANATNDINFDPYIQEGNEIYVPYPADDYPLITIAGAVVRPFVTAHKNDDMVSMLLKLGGGLKEHADLSNVRLIQPMSNKSIDLKINDKMELQSQDIELEPGASIIIGKNAQLKSSNHGVVSIIGNVFKPGVYPITNLKTTVKELVEEAGGFTDEAYLPLAYIIRRDKDFGSPTSLKYKMLENFQYSSLTAYDTTRYQIDVMLRQPRVSCDFVSLFRHGNEKANTTLKDGDIIKIPSNPGTVFVYGQVRNPGYVEFTEGKNMQWYIEKAGGFLETAEEDAARIIRGNNKTWVEGKDVVLVFAGDEIYAPAPSSIPIEAETQTYTFIASIATTALALLQNIYWWTRP